MNKHSLIVTCVLILACIASGSTNAHQTSTSFLQLHSNALDLSGPLSARWKIGMLDLEVAIGLDDNHDGQIVWGEILANQQRISQFANAGIKIQHNGQDCAMIVTNVMIDKLNSGLFVVADLLFNCATIATAPLILHYKPMLNVDSSHKGIVNYTTAKDDITHVLAQNSSTIELVSESRHASSKIVHFVVQGIWHIWIGIDHILFLLALLMPSVLVYKNMHWQVQAKLTPLVKDVVKIVTTFTIAHSITLIAATMQWVSLSTWLVETVIAISVAIGGLLIFIPIQNGFRLGFVFIFGLIHGFGFANVLADLMVSQNTFWVGTLGFNIGVEIGQLVIVLAVLPLFYFCRKYRFYQGIAMPVGAVTMIITGVYWALQRSLV